MDSVVQGQAPDAGRRPGRLVTVRYQAARSPNLIIQRSKTKSVIKGLLKENKRNSPTSDGKM